MSAISESQPIALGKRRDVTSQLLVPATFAIFLLLWEAAVRLLEVPAYILPTPTNVLRFAYNDLASGIIIRHFFVTLNEVLDGGKQKRP